MKRRVILFYMLLLLCVIASAVQASNRPTITYFGTTLTAVQRATLEQVSARIPVGWSVVNRHVTMNLIFEQVLPDGRVVNVELPRPHPWVNSSGMGIAAPVDPGPDASEIVLQVRLYSFLTGETFDTHKLTLPIITQADPAITRFETTPTTITWQALQTGTVQIPVYWQVINRPANANLYFEQLLPDRIINVELPRPHPWVNSSGWGIVAPLAPPAGEAYIELRLSLRDMTHGHFYADSHIRLAIADAPPSQYRVNRFTVTPLSVPQGASVTISWDVSGTSQVMVALSNYAGMPSTGTTPIYPNTGILTLDVPPGVQRFDVLLRSYIDGQVTQDIDQAIGVEVLCTHQWLLQADSSLYYCPHAPQTIGATYQQFEHGYMVTAGTGYIWAYFDAPATWHPRPDSYTGGLSPADLQAFLASVAPPSGLLMPGGTFEGVWASGWMRDHLGWAVAPAQAYSATFQSSDYGGTIISLPDGGLVQLPRPR